MTTFRCSMPRAAMTAVALLAGLAPATIALAEGTESTLEEVIVTAQRQSERIQEVPIAISAISNEDLQNRGVRQAMDITGAVPNLTLSLPYGEEAQPTFALRGVTTNDWSQNQSSPIAMYVDEVFKPVGAVQALQTFDLDRVEVLRGPQGTLYGKNATGGAMSFYSKNPSLSSYDGYATIGVGNYDLRSVEAAVGGPLVDGVLGWRLAAMDTQRDGYIHSVVPGVKPLSGVDATAVRLSMLWSPSQSFSALLKVSTTRSRGTPYGATALNSDNDPNSVTYIGTAGNYGGWWNSGAKYAIPKKVDSDAASLKLDWQVNEHYTVTAVSGYDHGDWWVRSDDGALWKTDAGSIIHTDDPNLYASSVTAISQEIRIASHDTGNFSWLGGAFYGRDMVHFNLYYHFFDTTGNFGFNLPDGTPLQGFDEFNSFDQQRISKALFLNATYKVTPDVTLRGGIRRTRDDMTIRNFYALEGGMLQTPTAPGPDTYPTYWTQTIPNDCFLATDPCNISYVNYSTSFAPQGLGVVPDMKQGDSNTSIKLGVDWKIQENVLGYLSYSQGYRGSAFNGQAMNNPSELTFAKPEKLNAYEAGIKSTLLDRRLELNGSIFSYKYREQQFLDTYCAFPTATSCGGSGFLVTNAPRSKINGGEIELHARPASNLDVRASVSALSSKYEELFLHYDLRCNCKPDRSGNQLIMAPKLSGNLAVDWRAAQLSVGDLHLMLDGNYYGKQYFDALNTERISQGAYSVYNARVALLGGKQSRWSFALWAKNLGNRKYLTYGLAQKNIEDGGLGEDYGIVGAPRMVGFEVTARL